MTTDEDKESVPAKPERAFPQNAPAEPVFVNPAVDRLGVDYGAMGYDGLEGKVADLRPGASPAGAGLPDGGGERCLALHPAEPQTPASGASCPAPKTPPAAVRVDPVPAGPFVINTPALKILCEVFGRSEEDVRSLVSDSYGLAAKRGLVRSERGRRKGQMLEVFPLLENAPDGRRVEVKMGPPNPGDAPHLFHVSTRPVMGLSSYATVASREARYAELESMLPPECWGTAAAPRRFLHDYVDAVFVRAMRQRLVLEEGPVSGFDTGLRNKGGEDVCMLFERGRGGGASSRPEFIGFASRGGTGLSARYAGLVCRLRPPTFFDRLEDMTLGYPESLDYGKTHIIAEHVERLPVELLLATHGVGDPRWADLMDRLGKASGDGRRDLEGPMREVLSKPGSRAFSMIDAVLTNAIDDLLWELQGNPSLALPIYNPARDETGFVAPLSACSADGRPNMVLLVEKQGEGRCFARTVLTPAMAYVDHRAVCRRIRPNWLTDLVGEGDYRRLADENERMGRLLERERDKMGRLGEKLAELSRQCGQPQAT